MKIMFLTHRVPYPPNRGDKLRAFNILKHLSKSHSVSLFCLADEAQDLKCADELRKYCNSVDVALINIFWARLRSIFGLFQSAPLTLAYFYSAGLKRLIKQRTRTEKFDLIFIYSSSMAQYVLDIRGIPKIMDFVDVDSDKWRQYAQYAGFPQRLIYQLEQRRLREYERTIANSVERCIVTSKQEAQTFKSFIPKMRVSPIPNGVDFAYFKPDSFNYEENRLVFTGQMDYFANIDGILYFCREILPLIRREIPDVKLYVVGNKPTKDITNLTRDNNIVVAGFVEDVRPYIRKSAVCVVPLRIARGIQNKILEAMAMGVPVVTTSQAAKGIEVQGGEDIFVEDEPQQFAQKVIELLKDRELRKRVASSAREAVEQRYNWDINLAEIDAILGQVNEM